MGRPKVEKACKRCGASSFDGVYISRRDNCPPCGEAALSQTVHDMKSRSGAIHDAWVKGMAKAVRNGRSHAAISSAQS